MDQISLGKVYVTRGIFERYAQEEAFSRFVSTSLFRMSTADWGEISPDDQALNQLALQTNDRLHGVYIYSKDQTKIWIITEAGHQITTVLFPDEY